MTSARASRGASWGVAWAVVSSLWLVGVTGCPGRKSSGTAGGGTECKVNVDCPVDQFCVSGVCAQPGMAKLGARCTATRDCEAGLYCGAAGTCAMGGAVDQGGSCTTDAVCKPGLRCTYAGFFGTCGPAGTRESGAACAASTDCLAGLLCGASETCLPPREAFPPYEGATCEDDGPFRVYFEVPRPGKPPRDFFRLPFPNDARVAGGKLDISDFPKPGPTPLGVDLVQLYVDAWTEDFDGFSSIGVTTFRFSGDVDFNTVDGSTVWLVDVTPGAAGRQYARDFQATSERTKYSCQHRLTVRNTTDAPLAPRHTYAAILTKEIKSDKGEALVVDPDMAALLASTAPADATLMHAWDVYKPLRDWLADPGKDVVAPKVAAAAVFTVQDAPGHMQRLAAAVAKAPGPVFKDLVVCGPGVKSPCDDGTPARACGAGDAAFDEIHGRFTVPIFQQGTAPYETPDQGGGIVEEAGVPRIQRTEDVCFAAAVPKGKPPQQGWPLVVYHHGTGGSMRSFIDDGVAARLVLPPPGTAASIVFSFDAVEHGARRGDSKKKPDDLVFNPLNPRAARDNFLQGAVDVLQAFRIAQQGGIGDAATAGAVFAPVAPNVAFFGHSQGSTSGALAVAVSDAAPAVVLSGAGSFLTRSLLDKTSPVNIAAGLVFLLGEPLDAEHPVLTLFQSFFDRSDPLSYNPLIIAQPPPTLHAKHVYMSYGHKDTYTPASTLDATVASLALPHAVVLDSGIQSTGPRPVTLNVTGGDDLKRTAGVFVYEPEGYDGHFVATRSSAAINDWAAFLGSYVTSGTPTVP